MSIIILSFQVLRLNTYRNTLVIKMTRRKSRTIGRFRISRLLILKMVSFKSWGQFIFQVTRLCKKRK